jgi:hypothetical protein
MVILKKKKKKFVNGVFDKRKNANKVQNSWRSRRNEANAKRLKNK